MQDRAKEIFIYVGGGISQKGVVEDLLAHGFNVAVTDRDSQCPAREIAAEFCNVSATDAAGILEFCSELIDRGYRVCGAYGVADYAADAIFSIASKFDLAGPAGCDASSFTDKVKTIERLSAFGLPVPKTLYVSSSGEWPEKALWLSWLGNSVVVKARSENNSRNVFVCRDCNEASLFPALEGLRKTSTPYMVEEFVEGRVGNVDGLMIEGVFYPVSTTIRVSDPDYPSICKAMVQPANCWDGYEEEMYLLAQEVARALGYTSGPFTVDILIGEDNKVHVLEVSPHFHCLYNEVQRGNGNPLAAYFSHLSGDADWRRYLLNDFAKVGICLQGFASFKRELCLDDSVDLESFGNVEGIDRLTCNFKPGEKVVPVSNGRALLYLAWLSSEDRTKAIDNMVELESGILERFL